MRWHFRGALTATLGGLDALIFTAGIGEHSARTRREICFGMEWLGLSLDETANVRGAPRIEAAGSPTAIFVIATDEEGMIAEHTIVAAGVGRLGAAA